MKISDKGVGFVKAFEGCRLMPYTDSVGVWTVGYGSTTDVTPGRAITMAQAEERLKEDLSFAEKCVNDAVTVPLTQPEFDALVSIVFNVGPGSSKRDGIIRLKSGEPSTLLRKLNDSDYDGAAEQFLRWDKAGGRPLAGLTRRRKAEAEMFESAA